MVLLTERERGGRDRERGGREREGRERERERERKAGPATVVNSSRSKRIHHKFSFS